MKVQSQNIFFLVALTLSMGLIFQNCSNAEFSTKGNNFVVDPGALTGQEVDDDVIDDLDDISNPPENDDDDLDNDVEVPEDPNYVGQNCQGGAKEHKVLICHVPSGDVAKARTLCIAIAALKGHENSHGKDGDLDYVGACLAAD